MDKDEAIRTLLGWFGYREFRVNGITDEDNLWEISELVGANTLTSQGRRIQLGKRLTEMDGYRCSTEPHLGAMLTVERAEGSRPAVFQIKQS